MHHLTGKDHIQTFSVSLEASIQADIPVRIIDAFVDALPLASDGQAGQASELMWKVTCLASLD
ncbi:hypothetical protein [Cesiribacter sp. SM1]|uniref:hypothetical protein n=1 Tax=Cesiribacter sp. SM1 TaxID=2861196 RepID=UPI001CD34727|nr:hypothetical protein [Cesiribacter sp. SM1]